MVDMHETEHILVPNRKGNEICEKTSIYVIKRKSTELMLMLLYHYQCKQCNSIVKLVGGTSNMSTHGHLWGTYGRTDTLVHSCRYTSTLYR